LNMTLRVSAKWTLDKVQYVTLYAYQSLGQRSPYSAQRSTTGEA
jgi:hypothetical protein